MTNNDLSDLASLFRKRAILISRGKERDPKMAIEIALAIGEIADDIDNLVKERAKTPVTTPKQWENV